MAERGAPAGVLHLVLAVELRLQLRLQLAGLSNLRQINNNKSSAEANKMVSACESQRISIIPTSHIAPIRIREMRYRRLERVDLSEAVEGLSL